MPSPPHFALWNGPADMRYPRRRLYVPADGRIRMRACAGSRERGARLRLDPAQRGVSNRINTAIAAPRLFLPFPFSFAVYLAFVLRTLPSFLPAVPPPPLARAHSTHLLRLTHDPRARVRLRAPPPIPSPRPSLPPFLPAFGLPPLPSHRHRGPTAAAAAPSQVQVQYSTSALQSAQLQNAPAI
ncbi:hypothetical protein FB451DRAFT_1556355 [Mycena latifolia]|nr:hypothetical protein FB451DRAFT_1556355 [Mycena latifolia]